MAQSATEFGQELFSDFKNDDFFAPAFKSISWVRTTPPTNVFSGNPSTAESFSGSVAEIGGSAKQRKIKDMDGIDYEHIYIKGSLSELPAPALNETVTFNGEDFKVIFVTEDPVNALFECFLGK